MVTILQNYPEHKNAGFLQGLGFHAGSKNVCTQETQYLILPTASWHEVKGLEKLFIYTVRLITPPQLVSST